jgi:hypothetical protein
MITLETKNIFDKGSYNVKILAYLRDYKEVLPGVASFKISVKGNTEPKINGFLEAFTVAPG